MPPGFEDIPKFYCEFCSAVFLFKLNLQNHKKLKHPNNGVPNKFICDKCDTGLDYKTERSLLKHYFTDHGTVPTALQNTKKFVCSECPKIYTKKRSLEAHKLTKHSNIPMKPRKPKPQVQCGYCEKIFTTQVAARNHIIVKHEKSCQFHCHLCTGKYPTDLKLRRHIDDVHVTATCELCGENFTRVELKKHKANVHGIGMVPTDKSNKPFRCPFCPLSFKSKRGLIKHSEVKHEQKIEVHVENVIDMRNEGDETVQFIIA